ncbi:MULTISPECIES: hypothetical protein [Haloarcula]|uniref:Bacterial Ig-like domain-containing protein n=3 Tax=Haloarcula TaxID=2237 RepID=A0A830EQW3_9EURY|nr:MULTISPECIES: hypothetical protein [Haloarcula]EMA31521.1 hypothetical protein C444_08000 [Haloarcula japonica DSM 6131]GGK85395.1 hypothetical protein GCM10009067_41900 [Haloarcula sebkhae]
MSQTLSQSTVQAVGLSIILILSFTTVTVTFSDSASAAVSDSTLNITEDVAAPDGTVEITGNLDSDSSTTVTFLIEDASGNSDYISKSDSESDTLVDSGSFTTEIDLSSLDTTLDEGTATVKVDHRDGYIEPDDSTTFAVDDTAPTVELDSISEPTSAPTVEGTARDKHLDKVEVAIRDSNDNYYDGSDFSSASPDWRDAQVSSGDWSYDMSQVNNLNDGEYRIYVRATDKASNTASYFDGPDYSDLKQSFTLDTTDPQFNSNNINKVSVIDQTDGDGEVQVGDTVSVSADVTDATSGIDTVTVDASNLGESSSLSLSLDSGSTYKEKFTVSDPDVGDGSVSLTVSAKDDHGNTATESNSIDLVTDIASVSSLTIHQNFIGIVKDENTTVRVTADGIADPRGNAIVDKDTTLRVGGHNYDVPVSSGSIDTRINPEQISNSQRTGDVTVELTAADSGSATDTVTLVDEANNLKEGYQIEGTPMDAESVDLQYTNSQLHYDPTDDSWDSNPDLKTAGSAYYIHGINNSARIGYTFSDSSGEHTRHLYEGYNLVTATPDLNDGSTISESNELGSISLGTSDNVYVSKSTTDSASSPNNMEFKELSSGMTAYQGYYIYIDSGEKYGVIKDEQYDP